MLMQANTGIEAIPDKSTKQTPSFSFAIQLIINVLYLLFPATILDFSASDPLGKMVPATHFGTS